MTEQKQNIIKKIKNLESQKKNNDAKRTKLFLINLSLDEQIEKLKQRLLTIDQKAEKPSEEERKRQSADARKRFQENMNRLARKSNLGTSEFFKPLEDEEL